MRGKPATVQMVALTDEHRGRFQHEAPAALARRDHAWFAEQSWGAVEPALAGGVPLVGMWLFGWTGLVVFAFALAAIWNAVWCDVAKLLFARAAVDREVERWNVDRSFWVIAEAIKDGKREMRADALTEYRPGAGLFMDFVAGGVATGVMLACIHESPLQLLDALTGTTGAYMALASMLGIQWLATLATIVRHRLPGNQAPMRFAAGARGLGLFLIMFSVVMAEGRSPATVLAVVMNAGLLVLAALAAFGVHLLRAETEWLRGEVAKGGHFP